MACWGLNLQYGYTGILNFSFIVYHRPGAYTAAVLTLGPNTAGSFQQYIGGANLPFPLPVIAGGIAAACCRRLSGVDRAAQAARRLPAMVFLVISLIATAVVTDDTGLFNGPAGLSLIPPPMGAALNLSLVGYRWFYVGLTAVICLIVYCVRVADHQRPARPVVSRRARPRRGAAALGKNMTGLRMTSFVIGGVIAGISGPCWWSSSAPGPPAAGSTRRPSSCSPR